MKWYFLDDFRHQEAQNSDSWEKEMRQAQFTEQERGLQTQPSILLELKE